MGSWAPDLYSNDWALDFAHDLVESADLASVRSEVANLRSDYGSASSDACLLVIADIFATVGNSPSEEMPEELRAWCEALTETVRADDLRVAEEFLNEILVSSEVLELRGDPDHWHPHVLQLLERVKRARASAANGNAAQPPNSGQPAVDADAPHGSVRDSRRSLQSRANGAYDFGTSGSGPVDERVQALRNARHLYRELDDTEGIAWCELDLGIITGTELGDLDGADAGFSTALELFLDLAVWRGAGLAIAKLANLAVVRGDVARARRTLEDFESRIALLDPLSTAVLAGCWAEVHQSEGNWAASVTDLERAVTLYERAGAGHELLSAHTRLGAALLACGRIADAERQAELADATRRAARPVDVIELPRLRAEVAVARGDVIAATAHLEAALDAPHVTPADELYVRLQWGELALRADNLDDAERELRKSLELARRLQIPVTTARALEALSSCLHQRGQVDAAFELARECVALTDAGHVSGPARQVQRHVQLLDLATAAGETDAARQALADVVGLLDQLDDLSAVAKSASAVVDALHATGDTLGARRVAARLP